MNASVLKSWSNILAASLNPAKAKVMAQKAIKRLSDEKGSISAERNRQWLEAHATPLELYVRERFGYLRAETDDFCAALKTHSDQALSRINHDLGGGGGVPLLYALVRDLKPAVVVETGVAAGFSSASILGAMEKNGAGHLYSSDFPYFRIENAEKYIGAVVAEPLKARWSLHIKGDRDNIPAILREIPGPIDLFHYDSDKSYDGRAYILSLVQPRMAASGTIIMDDIQDNPHFHDWVSGDAAVNWSVFSYRGKYIGMIKTV